jgi:flagellar basal-body rod protein FlgC
MGIMTAIEIGASGLSAHRKRLEVHVSNLANADVAQKTSAEAYRPKKVVFASSNPESSFGSVLDDAVQGVEISKIVEDDGEPKRKLDPDNPMAGPDGFVYYPNVNEMMEMADVLQSARSYEANVQAVNMAKEMQQKTLEMLK